MSVVRYPVVPTQLIRGSNPSYLLEKQACSLYTNEPGAALCRLIYLRASDEVGKQLARSPAENRTRSHSLKGSWAGRYPTGPGVPLPESYLHSAGTGILLSAFSLSPHRCLLPINCAGRRNVHSIPQAVCGSVVVCVPAPGNDPGVSVLSERRFYRLS